MPLRATHPIKTPHRKTNPPLAVTVDDILDSHFSLPSKSPNPDESILDFIQRDGDEATKLTLDRLAMPAPEVKNTIAENVPNKLVTAAIIRDGDKLLIARRGPNMKLAGSWEFPGGKVEAGETPEDCLKRELIEELSIEVEIGRLVCFSDYTYDHGSFRILAYDARVLAGQPQTNEHDQLVFVTPGQLLSFKLLPADIPIAKKIATH